MAFIDIKGIESDLSDETIRKLQWTIFNKDSVVIDRMQGIGPHEPVPGLEIYAFRCIGDRTTDLTIVVDGLFAVEGDELYLRGCTRTKVAERIKRTVDRFFHDMDMKSEKRRERPIRVKVYVRPIEVCLSPALEGVAC